MSPLSCRTACQNRSRNIWYTIPAIESMPYHESLLVVHAAQGSYSEGSNWITRKIYAFPSEAYRAPVQSNSLEARTSGAIALYPKENHSRSWVFLDINTGYVFTSTKWHALPLSDIIIDYLNQFDNMISAQRSRKDERPPP